MIRLFSNNYNQTIFFLIVFAFGLRSAGFVTPYVNTNAPLALNYIQQIFNYINYYPQLGFFVSTFLVIIAALVFNRICNKHGLVIVTSYLPAYFYIVLNSVFVDQFYAGPVLFVNLFMIVSLGSILNLYHSDSPYFSLFSASFLAGLSALLNTTYMAFFVIVLLGINVFRPFNFREHISAFVGFLMPLYIGTMLNYLLNGNFLPFYIFFPDYGSFNNQFWALKSMLPFLGFIFVLAILRMNKNYFRNTIKQRRAIQLMVLTIVMCVVLMTTGKQNPKQEFSFVAFPLAFYFSYYFTNSRFNFLKELLNILLIAGIIFFHYWG